MEHSGTAMQMQTQKTKSFRIKRSAIVELIGGFFILLFLYTSLSKLFDHQSFRNVLFKSPLIFTKANFVAWAIPIVELIVVGLLFVPRLRRWGLYSSLVLMIGFTAYLTYMIYFTPFLPCSCGGILSEMTWREHLVFNIGATLLAATGILLSRKRNIS